MTNQNYISVSTFCIIILNLCLNFLCSVQSLVLVISKSIDSFHSNTIISAEVFIRVAECYVNVKNQFISISKENIKARNK